MVVQPFLSSEAWKLEQEFFVPDQVVCLHCPAKPIRLSKNVIGCDKPQKDALSFVLTLCSVLQLGWGFSDHSLFTTQQELCFGPQQKREHLYSFWQENIGRPMVLTGASLGGAIAIDFAFHYPEVSSEGLGRNTYCGNCTS
jgi:hypothetical protein